MRAILALSQHQATAHFTASLKELQKSVFFTRLFSVQQQEFINAFIAIAENSTAVLTELTQKDQTWLVIFQNSNELRATGGFMGSYALLTISQGIVSEIVVEDIFDADGQFEGYVDAPQGVAEYLSSARGMRLPDANWHPDFTQSAQQILAFFAFGNRQNITGITAVNVDFAKALLELTGPIELNDYNTTVTSGNIDEVLRSRRDTFFPSSTQKKHLLSQLLVQTRLKLTSIIQKNVVAVLLLTKQQVNARNIQFYSGNPAIDIFFTQQDLRLELPNQDETATLYPVESNVGINKANMRISRKLDLSHTQDTVRLKTLFINDNKKPDSSALQDLVEPETTQSAEPNFQPTKHLAYINYHRFIIPMDWELTRLTYKGEPITSLSKDSIKNSLGQELQQIGFLLTLQEQESAELQAIFTVPKNNKTTCILRQPGTAASSLAVTNQHETTSLTLEKAYCWKDQL